MFEVIINPAGAGGRTMKTWQKTKEYLEQYHIDYREHFSELNYGIDEIAADLTAEDKDVDLLIIGGDGSLNLAVNGIRDFARVRLAFVPSGSGNDYAKALNVPSDPLEIVKMLKDNTVRRRVNIGKMTYLNRFDKDGNPAPGRDFRLFNISSGIGFDAAICEEVQRAGAKKVLNLLHMGRQIYIWVALHQIFTARRSVVKITLDDGEVREYGKLLLAVGMNTAYEGGGFKFGPDADPEDSLLDLCIADHLSQFDFFRIFPYAYSGSHVKFKGVEVRKTKKAEIETDTPVWVHTDGEIEYMSSHIRLELLDAKLKLMV